MLIKNINIVLVGIFYMVLIIPFLLSHKEDERVSDMENRTLAGTPHILGEDGKINLSYPADFDSWINDNIRFRTILMEINASLQYNLFGKIANNSLREGKEGHLYYVDEGKVHEYQHTNLLSTEALKNYADAMQALDNYFKKQGIFFYYMQCFDKDSIYPEYYVEGVNQFGDTSRALQVVKELRDSNINVIPVYEELINNKGTELLYFKVTDPAHWNEYGAHIVYSALLKSIQEDFPDAYRLEDKDYDITRFEGTTDIYGFTYPYKEDSLRYKIKNPLAAELNLDDFDRDKVISYREYGHYYINDKVSNDLKIMVVGDSYIRQFLKGHIAEGFKETLSIDWSNLPNLDQVLDIYKPDIIVLESAEFFLDRTIPLVESVPYISG